MHLLRSVPSAPDADGAESSEGSEPAELEQGRWLAWTDERGALALAHLPPPALVGRLGNLLPEHSLQLLPGETVKQVRCLAALPPCLEDSTD